MKNIWNSLRSALIAFFRSLPGFFRNDYLWRFLLGPVLFGFAVYFIADANVMGWQDSDTAKATLEIVHPSLLAIGALAAMGGWLTNWSPAQAYIGLFCVAALAREIGGQGTSFILYVALIGLIVYAHLRGSKIKAALESRLVMSLVATAFLTYAFSQLLDRGLIKRIGRLLTWDSSWKLSYSSQIEESLEAVGGGFLLMAVIATFFVLRRRQGAKETN